ncbi:MAG: siroheme synthase CysG [Pseudomonadota bacterium]
MQAFPMFISTTGRRVVIAGGGEQAAQKARLLLKTDAKIDLVAPSLDAELQGIVAAGRARHDCGPVSVETFRGAALCFVATGCPGADTALAALAKEAGALLNVVDRPDLCDAITPAIVDRDPVVVAIGTEGTAPVLGRVLKTEIETLLPPRIGGLAALAGRLRGAVAAQMPKTARRAFWAWVFKGAPAALYRRGEEAEAARSIKAAIAAGQAPQGPDVGHIALVGAGPGARDLLTLRAVERLQEADIIFYDRLVDPQVLELARRDAERVFVGKAVGATDWPQERIKALIVAEARKGRRVVRLKSGDPAIFARATEEASAARAAGIEVEIVPGVTAASAAAATLGQSLTARGDSDTVILATGTCRPGDALPDWAYHLRPGTTLALYMGVRMADQISATLRARGAPPETPVDVAAHVSTPREQRIRTPLAKLSKSLAEHGIDGAAMILITVPKNGTAARTWHAQTAEDNTTALSA